MSSSSWCTSLPAAPAKPSPPASITNTTITNTRNIGIERGVMNDIVLLNLRISMWGVSRVLPDHEYQVDADKAMVRATKKILECPEYEFLLQLKRSIHRRLRTLALPGEILRAGVYPISVGIVQAVEKTLEDFSVR